MSPPIPSRPPNGGPSPARLVVDRGAVVANWRAIAVASLPARTAAVVKADAYGLGMVPVAVALAAAGCEDFFVATFDEARSLRSAQPGARIWSLGGLPPGTVAAFLAHAVVPVLNTADEVREWVRDAGDAPAAVHLDSGMTRLGLGAAELDELRRDGDCLERLRLALVVSHLACADEHEHPLNARQIRRFDELRSRLPAAPTSLGNSAGTLLGPRARGDLVRPGIALYGGNPFSDGTPNPMREVVRLQARVLQVRDVAEADVTIGYGATHRVRPPARIATVAAGYADGYPRAAGGHAWATLAGHRVPVVGRVSMDLVTLDVTNMPRDAVRVGDYADLIGGGIAIDEIARLAGTISYEILARLSSRAERVYLD
jgi:alanine racemase